MRIIEIFKEINNYYFIKKVIRKIEKTPEWVKLNLRKGWFGVMYTVINLPPEVFQGEEAYYQVYIIEKMKPINEYLVSHNLAEIITPVVSPSINREKGEYAYLVRYLPLFREFTVWWVVSRVVSIAILVWLHFKFDVFTKIYHAGEIAFHWIAGLWH
jgi:hypothetical protein